VIDDEKDYSFPTWAGILPLEMKAGLPIADSRLDPAREVPGVRETLLEKAIGVALSAVDPSIAVLTTSAMVAVRNMNTCKFA